MSGEPQLQTPKSSEPEAIAHDTAPGVEPTTQGLGGWFGQPLVGTAGGDPPDLPGILALADTATRTRLAGDLQRRHGNAYVQRLLARRAASAPTRPLGRSATPGYRSALPLQRAPSPTDAAGKVDGPPSIEDMDPRSLGIDDWLVPLSDNLETVAHDAALYAQRWAEWRRTEDNEFSPRVIVVADGVYAFDQNGALFDQVPLAEDARRLATGVYAMTLGRTWRMGSRKGQIALQPVDFGENRSPFLAALPADRVQRWIGGSHGGAIVVFLEPQVPAVPHDPVEEVPEFLKPADSKQTANYAPFPARLVLPPAIAQPGSTSTFTMTLDKRGAIGHLVDDVTQYMQPVNFVWQVVKLDPNKLQDQGAVSPVAGTEQTVTGATGAGARIGQRVRGIRQDTEQGVGRKLSDDEFLETLLTDPRAMHQNLRLPLAVLGQVALELAGTVANPGSPNVEHTIQVPWGDEGYYLVRCIATPVSEPDDTSRRASSFEGGFMVVRSTSKIAEEALEVAIPRADVLDLDELDFQLEFLRAKREPAAAKGLDTARLDIEIEYLSGLRARLAAIAATVDERPTPMATVFISQDTNAQLEPMFVVTHRVVMPLSAREALEAVTGPEEHQVTIHAMTADGRFRGKGETREEAWTAALAELRDHLDLGRGHLAWHIEEPYKSIEVEDSLRSPMLLRMTTGAQAREMAADVVAVGTLAALLAAPFTEGASLAILEPLAAVSAGLSTYNMYYRYDKGRLSLDGEAFGDFLNMVGPGLGRASALTRAGTPVAFSGNRVAIRMIQGIERTAWAGGYLLMTYQMYEQMQNTDPNDPEARARLLLAFLNNLSNIGVDVTQAHYDAISQHVSSTAEMTTRPGGGDALDAAGLPRAGEAGTSTRVPGPAESALRAGGTPVGAGAGEGAPGIPTADSTTVAPPRSADPSDRSAWITDPKRSARDLLEFWFSRGSWVENLKGEARELSPDAQLLLDAARAKVLAEARAFVKERLAALGITEVTEDAPIGPDNWKWSLPGTTGVTSDRDPTILGPHTLAAQALFREGMANAIRTQGVTPEGWSEILGVTPYSDPRYDEFAIRGAGAEVDASRARVARHEFAQIELEHRNNLAAQDVAASDPVGTRWEAYKQEQIANVAQIDSQLAARASALYDHVDAAGRNHDAEVVTATREQIGRDGRLSDTERERLAAMSDAELLAFLASESGHRLAREARSRILEHHQRSLQELQSRAGPDPDNAMRENILTETMQMKFWEEEAYGRSAIESVVRGQQERHQAVAEAGGTPGPLPEMPHTAREASLLNQLNFLEHALPGVRERLSEATNADQVRGAMGPLAKYLSRAIIEATELGIPIGSQNQLLGDLARLLRARTGRVIGEGEPGRGATMTEAEAQRILLSSGEWGLLAGNELQQDAFLAAVNELAAPLRRSATLRALDPTLGEALRPDVGHRWREAGESQPTESPDTRREVARPAGEIADRLAAVAARRGDAVGIRRVRQLAADAGTDRSPIVEYLGLVETGLADPANVGKPVLEVMQEVLASNRQFLRQGERIPLASLEEGGALTRLIGLEAVYHDHLDPRVKARFPTMEAFLRAVETGSFVLDPAVHLDLDSEVSGANGMGWWTPRFHDEKLGITLSRLHPRPVRPDDFPGGAIRVTVTPEAAFKAEFAKPTVLDRMFDPFQPAPGDIWGVGEGNPSAVVARSVRLREASAVEVVASGETTDRVGGASRRLTIVPGSLDERERDKGGGR